MCKDRKSYNFASCGLQSCIYDILFICTQYWLVSWSTFGFWDHLFPHHINFYRPRRSWYLNTNNGNESINRKESKLKTHLVLATPGGLHVICLCSRLQPLPTKQRNAAQQEVGGRMLVVGVSTPIQLVLEDQLFSRFLFSLLFHVPSVFMNINNFTVRGDGWYGWYEC